MEGRKKIIKGIPISNFTARDRESMGCKAERQHHPDCPCIACRPRKCDSCYKLTRQHEIPTSIGTEIAGLAPNELNENTRMLSRPCHALEDKKIPLILELMRILKKEGMIPTKETVLEIRRMGFFEGTNFPQS